ncbi:MAG: hypothetical protein GXP45_03390 [bacterium]|nr:hypothetical protein [bacterium]
MFKKILFLLFFPLGFLSLTFAQVLFEPEFGDARFLPTDSYHAGCLNTLDFRLVMKDVKQVHLILNYDEKMLDILQLKGEYEGTYTVAYDNLTMDFTGNITGDHRFAEIQFKNKDKVKSSIFVISKDSYVLTKK